jgi:hypothetical protein
MRLKCTATISRMYTMSNEALVAGEVDMKSSGLHISENLSQGITHTSLNFTIHAILRFQYIL